MFKILVDADSCPVIDLTIKVAKQFKIPVTLVCDTSHQIQKEGAITIIVDKGADASDFVLINLVNKGDVVITQDYGLAAMVLAKEAYCINQNGRAYTNENMDTLLAFRHIAKKVHRGGGRLKGPKKNRN